MPNGRPPWRSQRGLMFQTKLDRTLETKLVSKTVPPMTKAPRPLFAALQPKPTEGRQRRLMAGALLLLLMALGLLLYKDRDFWFPDDTQEADELPTPTSPAADKTAPAKPALVVATAAPNTSKAHATAKPEPKEAAAPAEPTPAPPATVTNRTVLPPLEVEVVAGDIHKTVRPGTNQVHVDLQPGAPPRPVTEAPASDTTDTPANTVTSNAAERVQMSADTAAVVTRSVKPGYPLLARQMKVQGSVILQALIGRDGLIQDIHVLSGPPILAGAAEEAVRQWHFKPHYQGQEAVETQAKITVNFTISTN